MKRLAVLVLVAGMCGPAYAAEECTEAKADALSDDLFKLVENNPGLVETMQHHIGEIEKEYGGEPPVAETCAALRKLMVRIQAEG